MASLQLCSMWQARMVHKYCLSLRFSHQQQRPWICNVYRSATWKYSKTSGPVRYTPRSVKLPKQPATQKQDEHIDNGLYHHHDVEGTNKHVPAEAQQVCKDPSLAMGCDRVIWKGEIRARSGFFLEQENDMSRASVETQHVCESRHTDARDNAYESRHDDATDKAHESSQNDARDLHRSSVNSAEIYTKLEPMRRATQEFSGGSPHPLGLPESDVEMETFSQAFKASPSLPVQGKHFRKREPDLQGRKVLPCQDVESFLLKVQKAKQRGLKPPGKPRVATTAVGANLSGDDNTDANDDSHDGKRHFLGQVIDDDEIDDSRDDSLFLGQDTNDRSEDVVGVDSTSRVSTSTAAQEHAKNQAIRYLALRPYTGFQLKKKLENRNIPPELADYALSIVQSCGLQSDLAYAETFSRARFNHGSWGPQRIKLGLKQRGVSEEIIQLALAMVFGEEKNDSEQYGASENCSKFDSLEMSKVAMDHLLLQATKQWNRGRNVTHETKIRRMVSWLQYRGFNYSVIKTVLNHLQKETRIEDDY